MNLTSKHAVTAIILALSVIAPAAAGPLDDADAAIKRRDYATAVRLIRPLAEQGDANASADLNARIRSSNLNESDTILRTRIIIDPKRSIRFFLLCRRLTGLLSGHPSRQHRNN